MSKLTISLIYDCLICIYNLSFIAATTEEVSHSPQRDNTGFVLGSVAGLVSAIVKKRERSEFFSLLSGKVIKETITMSYNSFL